MITSILMGALWLSTGSEANGILPPTSCPTEAQNSPELLIHPTSLSRLLDLRDPGVCHQAMIVPAQEAKLLRYNVLTCELPAFQSDLETYGSLCVAPDALAPGSTESQLLRHAELLEAFDREVGDLARLDPSAPAFTGSWRSFQEKWEALARQDPGATIDASPLLRPAARGGLASRLRALPELREATVQSSQTVREILGLPAGSTAVSFQLLQIAIFLKEPDALSAKGRDFMYRKYPELMQDPGLIGEAEAISRQLVNVPEVRAFVRDESKMAAVLERVKEQPAGQAARGKLGEDYLKMDARMGVIGQGLAAGLRAPSAQLAAWGPKLAALERRFSMATRRIAESRSRMLAAHARDPGALITDGGLVARAARDLNPQAAQREIQDLTAIYCRRSRTDEHRLDWIRRLVGTGEKISMGTGLGGMVVTAAGIGAAAFGAPVTAGVLATVGVAAAVGSMATGIPLSVYDSFTSLDGYWETENQFYSGLATARDVDRSHSELVESSALNTLNVAAMGIPIVRGSVAMRSAGRAALAGNEAATAAKAPASLIGRAVNRLRDPWIAAEAGTHAGLLGANVYVGVMTSNWSGLGIQLVGGAIMHGESRLRSQVPPMTRSY